MRRGRPAKQRIPGTGEKLLRALKLSGVTWGTRINSETHILNNERWIELGLPKSSNAILGDIRDGIPEDRLIRYSKYFNVSPDIFVCSEIDVSSREFESSILTSRYSIVSNMSFPPLDTDKGFCHTLYMNNAPDKTTERFLLLDGVYRLYVKENKHKEVYRAVLYIHSRNACSLIGKVFLKYMETNLVLRVLLFEMSTFFHVNYYAEDTYVVGYGVGMSPFYCFKALSSRPINLNFCCISGGFASTTRPDLFWVHAVKEEMACNKSKAEHYEEICRDIESSPILNVQDKDCDVIVERLDSIKKIVL